MKKTRKRTVVRAILYFVGALLIINSVYLLFSSNIHTGIIAELVIGALFFFCAVFFKAFYEKTAVWFKFMCVAICAAICAAPLFLLSHGTADTANYNEDVLIVLGAGINGTRVGENLKRRLDAALDYIEKNPAALIVVSGGKGFQEEITEAEAMEKYLVSQGADAEKIIKEEKATSTYENFVFSKKLLDEIFGKEYKISFVTNDFHVYRAHGLAIKAGFSSASHIHAPTRYTTVISNTIRECLAVAKYALIKK
jgi:uncharacterized SAM-binding protein YcdF (DUF218 family)